MLRIPAVTALLLAGACAADPDPLPPLPDDAPAPQRARERARERAAPAAPVQGRLHLSVEGALELALGGNHRIELGALAPRRRAEDYLVVRETFAPSWWTSVSGGADRNPPTNVFTTDEVLRDAIVEADAGVGKTWDTGLRTDLVFGYERTKTESSFFTLNPRHDTTVALELSQPLLAGFGAEVNGAELRRALHDRAIADAEFEVILEAELLRAYRAYWDLVLAREDLSLQEQSRGLAEEQVAIARDRLDAGVAARLEVTSAQAALARQEEAVIEARVAARRASDALLQVIRPRATADAYELEIEPATRPGTGEDLPAAPSTAEAVKTAMANRPELRREMWVLSNLDVDILLARDAWRPRLDVFGSAGVKGIDGTISDSLDELGTGDFREWTAGARMEYLFDAGSRRARWRSAMMAKREGEVRYAEIAASIVVEVRAALFELEAARQRLAATRRTLELATEQYEGELDRLRNGRSIQYRVELLRRDLLEAERQHLRSQVAVYVARAALDAAQGRFAATVVASAR